ncbi:MAG: hypothetical protein WKF96_01200 [Solirubrobacteraceae bacterium]
MNLPAVLTDEGLALADPDTGALSSVADASDHALLNAAAKVADLDRDLLSMKRTIANEMRGRYGVGAAQEGGWSWKVTESVSWPAGAVATALSTLTADGAITDADARRAMPAKPTPNGPALKALITRLTTSDPVAARRLADAASTSPPSLRDVRAVAVEHEPFSIAEAEA